VEGSLVWRVRWCEGFARVKGLLEVMGLLEAEMDLAVDFKVRECWVPERELGRLTHLCEQCCKPW
jgi:hypothetical protein